MKIDLYKGYEGEAEIIIELRKSGGDSKALHAWSALFDRVIRHIEPTGRQLEGIVLHHSLVTGWWGGDVWIDPDPTLTLKQIESVRRQCTDDEWGENVAEFRNAYESLLREALGDAGTVSIREE